MKKIFTSSNFFNFANFANFATGYFARVAALLLMLVTMSVGEVWGNYIVKGLPSDLDLGDNSSIILPGNTKYSIYIVDTGKDNAQYKWSSDITESVFNRDFWTGGEGGEVSFTTGATGKYTFSATYVADNHIRVSVTYPVAPVEEYTIYFKNTLEWSDVYVHFYTSDPNFSNGGNGCWGTGAVNKGIMTSIDDTYYSLTYTGPAYTRVCFTKENQDNYENFYNNQCSYSGSLYLSSANVLWIPNSESVTSCNNCSYYNSGTWTTYPETPAEYTGLRVSQTAGGAGEPVISADHVAQGGSVDDTAGAAADGYQWSGWTSENGTFGDASAMHTTFTPAANNAEAVAHYTSTAQQKVYFVNVEPWASVFAYAYDDTTEPHVKNANWPGEAANKEEFQICGKDVYSFSASAGIYKKIIFNNGGGKQTENLDWVADNYQYGQSGSYGNRASAEANCAPTISATTGEYCMADVAGQLKINVTCENVKSGDYYRIYSTNGAYYEPENNAASNSPTTWTATGGIAPGTYHFYAILYNSVGTELARSEEMVVAMEQHYAVNPIANDGNYGTVTSGPIFCTEHVQSAEITATPKSGYVFTSWQLPAGVTLAGGYAATDATIRVKATAAGTVTAVFAEDHTSSWYISGVNPPFGGWGTSGIQMTKVSENVFSAEVVAPSATPGEEDYQFKIYNKLTDKYWAANEYGITRGNNQATLEQNNEHGNMQFKPDMVATYRFTLNCTGGSPALSVTYPSQEYTITYGPCSSGHGSVSGTVASGSTVDVDDVITLTATPESGYYLKGWYGVESGDEQRLAYATSATNYVYTVENIQENKSIYAKFEAIPNGLKLDGQINGRDWNNCLDTTSSGATSYTWVFDNMSAQATKEFCFKDNECHSTAKIKPNMGYVTYAGDTYCTIGNSGASNYNFTLTTGDKYDVTITVTYGSGIHVTATAATPSPKITAIAIDPIRPREGNNVTVTPTLHYCTGTERICWSVVGQSIDFTDNGDGTYSFTAPAVGTYILKAQLRDAGNCGGNLLSEYSQTLRVYGDYIIIYAGMEAGWHDWQGIKACVGNGDKGTNDHTALEGVNLGEAGDGRHWFQFTLPKADTHAKLVLYNSVDEWPSEGIGSARTATLTKPTDDICYLVRGETIAFGNRRVDEGVCPSEPSVTITSSGHVVKDGTYTITARTIMIPGTVTYSYTVTDPSGNPVSVNAAGKFVASSTGTYHVTVRATGDGGISAISDVKEVVCEAASVTASVDPTSGVSVGGKVTLSAATTGFDSPTYQWFVQQPGGGWMQITGLTEKSGKYTVSKEGTYTFKVQVTENGHMVESNTCTSVVTGLAYWIKYRNAGNDDKDWAWHEMTFNNVDGTYYYNGYWNSAADGVNTNMVSSDEGSVWHHKDAIEFVGLTKTESMAVRYVFDGSSVKAICTTNTYYRVRSVCGDKIYYSNEVSPTAEGVDISFYAKQSGAIYLEKLEGGVWQPVAAIGAAGSGKLNQSSITADGVYTAKITTSTTTNGHLASVAMYTGDFYIFSEISNKNECRNENRMTKFNNISADEYYNHYWCVWVQDTKNTGATVGNAINHNLANALSRDMVSKMSVRYAYHPTTNHFSRAYLRGSGERDGYGDCFLKVYGTNVSNEDGSVHYTDKANGLSFNDGSNWVYTATIFGSAPATIKLAVCLDKAGDGTWDYLLSPTGSADYARNIYDQVDGQDVGTLRFYISYDFKTNRCIAAWYPKGSEDYDHMVTVDADLIVIRNAINGSPINMFTLSGEGGVKLIRKIYTAIELDRDSIFNGDKSYKSGLDKRLCQLSLPYDLDLLDVTGFLDYGTKMNLQVYSGELRALLGWQTYIETFWSNMAYQSSSKIQAERGYVIKHSLAYDDFKTIGEGVKQIARITLYFPSKTNIDGYIIGPTSRYGTSVISPITCGRPGREVIDSNWRCIGLPGFYPASAAEVDPETITGGTNDPATNIVTPFVTPRWVYDWNGSYMSYTAYRATNFRFMPTQNYMMQYAGSITWGEAVGSNTGGTTDYPSTESPVAARHAAVSEQSEGEYCLRLTDESGEMLDQTFIVLDHKASDAYEMNMDLQKMVTNGAPQIYSVAGGQTLAANAVCDTTTRVMLGTNLPDGEIYTFRLEDMSAGARVPYLYDAMTGTYTNLATETYTFSENTGRRQGRFYLVFGYQAPQTPTALDNVTSGFSAAVVDGKIVLSGMSSDLVSLYDAAGRLLYEQHMAGSNAIELPTVGGVYMVRNGMNTAKLIVR